MSKATFMIATPILLLYSHNTLTDFWAKVLSERNM